jgi:hypothetical protein
MKHITFLFYSVMLIATNSLYAQTYQSAKSAHLPRVDHQGQLLNNGNVLIFGGHNGSALKEYCYRSAEVYDRASNTWTYTDSMLEARTSFASVALHDGRILAIGGDNLQAAKLTTCEFYDPATKKWSTAPSLNVGVNGNGAVVLNNGNVLVAGGESSSELLHPHANQWVYTGSMKYSHYGASLIVLSDGKVLACGGNQAAPNSNRAEIYDPATGQWMETAGMMNVSRDHPGLVLLKNGKVLVYGSNVTATAQSELFDPATGQFTNLSDMHAARSYSAGVLLDDGRALLYGYGNLSDLSNIQAVELFDPATGAWATGNYPTPGKMGYSIHTLFTGEILVSCGNVTTGNGASTDCLFIKPSENAACTAPNAGLAVSPNAPSCYGKTATITITGSEAGVYYKARIQGTDIGTPVAGGGNINITLPAAYLAMGKNIVHVLAYKNACNAIVLTDTAQVTVIQSGTNKPKVIVNGQLTWCDNTTLTLTSSLTASAYQWSNGATTKSITVTQQGYYFVYLKNAQGCLSYPSDTVFVKKLDSTLPPNAGGDMSVCHNDAPFQLNGQPANGTWTGTGITPQGLFTPSATPTDGIYKMIYKYCDKADTAEIEVSSGPKASGFHIKNPAKYACYAEPMTISCEKTNPLASYILLINNHSISSVTGNDISWKNIQIYDTISYLEIQETVSDKCGFRMTILKDTMYLAPTPNLNLPVEFDTVCSGSIPTVKILHSEPGVRYVLIYQSYRPCSDTLTGNGGTLSLKVLYPVYEDFYFRVRTISSYGCVREFIIANYYQLYVLEKGLSFELPSPGGTTSDLFVLKNTSKNIISYEWNIDGVLSTLANPPPVSFSSTGIKTITLTGKGSVHGCIQKMTRTLEILDKSPAPTGSSCEYDTLPFVDYSISNMNATKKLVEKTVYAFHVDRNGNRYVAQALPIFNPNGGHTFYGLSLKKYNKNNQLLWEKKHGPSVNSLDHIFHANYIVDIESDPSGNIYIAGYFTGNSWKWDNVLFKSRSFPHFPESIGYLMKLDANGVAQWLMYTSDGSYNSTHRPSFTDIIYVNDNCIYAAINNPYFLVSPDGSIENIWYNDVTILQVNSAGKLKKRFSSSETPSSLLYNSYAPDTLDQLQMDITRACLSPKIALSSKGKLIIGGKSKGQIGFDNLTYSAPEDACTGFIAVLDTAKGWEKVSSLYSYIPTSLTGTIRNGINPTLMFALDKNDDVYISTSIDEDKPNTPVMSRKSGFTAKYDLDGHLKWCDSTTFLNERGIVALNNEILVYGDYKGFYASNSIGAKRVGMKGKGEKDIFVSDYSLDGKLNWVDKIENDSAKYGYSLVREQCSDQVYFCGGVQQPSSFISKKLTVKEPTCFIARYNSTGDCHLQNCLDCAGVSNGTAFIDSCGICAGGSTNIIPILDIKKCKNTGIEEQPAASIDIYPNPAVDKLEITASSPISELYIYNAIGAIVFTATNITGGAHCTLNITALPPAVYFVRIKTKDLEAYRHVLIAK